MVVLLALPLALSPVAVAEEFAVAEAGPSGEEVARLCVAHGRYCDCPGCRAFYGTCEIPCPLGEAPLAAPSEGGQPAAPEDTTVAPPTDLSNMIAGPTPSASSNFGAVSQSLSATPNMIGDSPTGGCGGLAIGGALVATIDTPIYACSRLNIAENNSAMVRDRLYMTYRHFHNASSIDLFSYAPEGRRSKFDTNQYTIAGEKRVGDWTSFEFRLPLYSQLRSDLVFIQGETSNNLPALFSDAVSPQVGNCSVIAKHVLRQSRSLTVSTGLGVNIPTGPDFSLTAIIDDSTFDVYDPQTGAFQTQVDADINANGTYRNETVNLQPFLAYQWRPGDLFFSNGFLQFDVPLNASPGEFTVTGIYNNTPVDISEAGTLRQQMLVRANLGGGVWLTSPPTARGSLAAALMCEMHYTGTLEPPDRQSVPIPVPGDDINLIFGPLADSTNALTAVVGVPIYYGPWSLYNGVGVPLRDGMDRGYDFEYSVTVQRQF